MIGGSLRDLTIANAVIEVFTPEKRKENNDESV